MYLNQTMAMRHPFSGSIFSAIFLAAIGLGVFHGLKPGVSPEPQAVCAYIPLLLVGFS